MGTLSIVLLVSLIVAIVWLVITFPSNAPSNSSIAIRKTESTTPADDSITFGDWYTIHTCPSCSVVIHDKDQARYYDRCCRKCGHSTGSLFDVDTVVVRDVYKCGKFIETVEKIHKVGGTPITTKPTS
jgi:hypothetical protein